MKIKFLFAWYDLWIGAFWDRRNRRLYLLPIPCVGVVIQFKQKNPFESDRPNFDHARMMRDELMIKYSDSL